MLTGAGAEVRNAIGGSGVPCRHRFWLPAAHRGAVALGRLVAQGCCWRPVSGTAGGVRAGRLVKATPARKTIVL
jgi:hypothetical protein